VQALNRQSVVRCLRPDGEGKIGHRWFGQRLAFDDGAVYHRVTMRFAWVF
jgi:hypothetical protein